MKDEIRKLFPLEFYINNKGEMVAEILLNTLNKLSDEITNLQEENKKLSKEIKKIKKEDYEIRNKNGFLVNGFHELDERIDKANNKLQTMFDNGNEETILDDLLELKDILQGSDKE